MSGLRVVLDPAPGRMDCRDLFMPGWEALDAGAMCRREVTVDGRRVALGDVATVSGAPGGRALLDGNWERADWVGAGLAAGTVEVLGSVGHGAATGQAGGLLIVRGNAGDGVAGAAPGRKRGMTGGEVVVHGNVGAGAGRAMRRGLLAVGGSAGRGTAYSMLAGTLVCLGALGPDAGILNARGSIVAAGPVVVPPVYRLACTFQPTFLAALLRRLAGRHGLGVAAALAGRWQRWSGDLGDLGRGEILVLEPR